MEIVSRLDELRLLREEWLNGQGKALDQRGLDWFADIFSRRYPEDLLLPGVYPTVEGNIRLEWTFDTREISLEVDLLAHSGEWDVLDVSTGVEENQVLDLTDNREWTFISERLREYMKAIK